MAFAWRARTSLRAAESEIAGLKAQIAAPDEAIAGPQGKPGETSLPRSALRPARARPADESLTNVLRRLDELAALQVKTLALVQTLADKVVEASSPEQKLKQREASIAALEAALRDQQQQAAAAKKAMDDLRVSLQVPEDVVALEPATGLALESLRQYWPYLEAKKNLQTAEQAAESLQRRLRQQRAEAAVDARESAAPK
jgi:vacuolar-type H+-ATPase subunit I/STV1